MYHCLLFLNSRDTPLVGELVEIVFILFNVHLAEDGRLGGLESVKPALGMMLSLFCTFVGIHDYSGKEEMHQTMHLHPNHLEKVELLLPIGSACGIV